MIKFKRQIYVKEKKYETWFGLDIKKNSGRPNVSIYYYTGDPDDKLTVSNLIKANFKSKEEAVKFGVTFMKQMYRELMNLDK